MDLNYFRQVAPVTDDILNIAITTGWALLIGNLVFQSMKSMATGLGFEGEDPKLLFTRSFVFAFLLLASQQICEIGLDIASRVVDLLQIPTSVTITIPDETNFSIGASWLLIMIVGFVIMWQFVRLCFEVAERYVVTAILVVLAPLAFGMGGSKNTADIFKGWCRMFGSMCVMMIMNVVFLKLLISALGYVPTGVAVLPWMLLIVGIARTARKIDSIIARIGLNPAITGDGLGRGLPGMVSYAVVRGLGNSIAKAASNSVRSHHAKASPPGNGSGRQYTNSYTPPPPSASSNPAGSATSSPFTSASHQAGTQSDTRTFGQSGGAASRQAVQDTPPSAVFAGAEDVRTPGMDSSSGKQGSDASPIIHTHGARRTSVPPGTRMGTRSVASFIRTSDKEGQGTLDHGRYSGTQDGAHPQSVSQMHIPAGKPGETGALPKSSTRISAAAGKPAEHSAHTGTSGTMRERPPIQQDRTPKIPVPPGVGGGEKKEVRSPLNPTESRISGVDSRHELRGASATLGSAMTRPPVGGSQAPEFSSPASGTAGIRSPSGKEVPIDRGSNVVGTAGIRAPSGHGAEVGKDAPASGSAGRIASTRGASQTRRTASTPGTAATSPPPQREPLSFGGSSPSSAMAGTRAPGGVRRSSPLEDITPAAAAGKTSKNSPADLNRGTKRMKQSGSTPPMSGGAAKPSRFRKNRRKS